MNRRVAFVIHLDLPENTSMGGLQQYIAEAVQCWRGQLRSAGSYDENDPGDPLFYLNTESITVTRYNRRRPGK